MNKIVFNKPYYDKEERNNLEEYILEDKDFVDEVYRKIRKITGAKVVFLTGSAASAMELYLASGLFPAGSEVVIPSFTYPAAANAVIAAGLKPVFADIDSKTLVLDVSDPDKYVSEKTSCIMPVHYGGASVDLDTLSGSKVHILEDAALSLGAYYRGRHLGTIGDAGVISFHRTKNISGEGGGVLIISNPDETKLFEEMVESGTNKRAFTRGEAGEYSWQRPGRGMNMGALNAAVLSAQLDKMEHISSVRGKLWNQYFECLSELGERIGLPFIPDYNMNNHHVFYILMKDNEKREKVRKALLEKGIQAVIHYMPLHSSPMGKKLGYGPKDCPVALDTAGRILRLPMHAHMTEGDVEYICSEVKKAVD